MGIVRSIGRDLFDGREGKIRAGGPFANAVLAGTVGGTLLPLMFMLEARKLLRAIATVACLLVVYCSTSSGPYLTAAFAMFMLGAWRWRLHLSKLWWGFIASLLVLHAIMNDPVWYLIARADITGGSVAYHRAELITQALAHMEDWWRFGTDHTRHWLPYGVPWSANHADITNYFIKMGVLGGLPVLLAFVLILVAVFGAIQQALRRYRDMGLEASERRAWCVISALAALTLSFIGVTPYDQSMALYFILFAMAPTVRALAFASGSTPPVVPRKGSRGPAATAATAPAAGYVGLTEPPARRTPPWAR